jgi:hypothetical protein
MTDKEAKQTKCMLCGKPAPKSICDLCASKVQSETMGSKKKERQKTEN